MNVKLARNPIKSLAITTFTPSTWNCTLNAPWEFWFLNDNLPVSFVKWMLSVILNMLLYVKFQLGALVNAMTWSALSALVELINSYMGPYLFLIYHVSQACFVVWFSPFNCCSEQNFLMNIFCILVFFPSSSLCVNDWLV